MHEKVNELNKLLGKDVFWITSDGDGEYSLSNSECMFYGYCNTKNMISFLKGMIMAIKCDFRKDVFL